jgi:hypothetical protein
MKNYYPSAQADFNKALILFKRLMSSFWLLITNVVKHIANMLVFSLEILLIISRRVSIYCHVQDIKTADIQTSWSVEHYESNERAIQEKEIDNVTINQLR